MISTKQNGDTMEKHEYEQDLISKICVATAPMELQMGTCLVQLLHAFHLNCTWPHVMHITCPIQAGSPVGFLFGVVIEPALIFIPVYCPAPEDELLPSYG
eukprot:1281233-Ditylum_brightwellii.AAC.1